MAENDNIEPNPFLRKPEHIKILSEAWNGIGDGDLAPLAAFLRSGLPLDRSLALRIASSIDGKPEHPDFPLPRYRIIAKGTKRGTTPFSKQLEDEKRKLRIADWVISNRLSSPKGNYEAIISEAQDHFHVSRSTITEACSFYKKALQGEIHCGDMIGLLIQVAEESSGGNAL